MIADNRKRSMATMIVVALLCVATWAVSGATVLAAQGDTNLVSVHSDGTQGNDGSSQPDISASGRYIAFHSNATNLVDDDVNGFGDIFWRDLQTGATKRVSVHSSGSESNNGSAYPAISLNGRYVAFRSLADNLVDNDTNGTFDVFVHDTQTGTTTRVSVHTDGTEGDDRSGEPDINANGRYVTFSSQSVNLVDDDSDDLDDVFVHDTQTGTTTRVSVHTDGTEGNGVSYDPSISANGQRVAFYSEADNLIDQDTNTVGDVFVHDRQSGITKRVSTHSDGSEGNDQSQTPSISANGAYVAFSSEADNLIDQDTNTVGDIFVHDTQTDSTHRVSVHSNGTEGDEWSWDPVFSPDSRFVAFEAGATNLVDDDTNGWSDVFIHDRQLGTTKRVSVHSDGTEGDDSSQKPAVADGYVVFDSNATSLVDSDYNGFTSDVFVHEYAITSPPTSTTTTTTTTTTTAPQPPVGGDYFTDDDGHLFEGDINSIAADGITRGCNPPINDMYCPDRTLTRAEAAAFVARALDLPAATNDWFDDDNGLTLEGEVNRLAEAGITRGCTPPDNDMFCPERTLTRAEAAAFVARALDLPAATNDWFDDDNGLTLEAEINRLAEAGITKGCNPPINDLFCPNDYLTRGEGAAFLNRAPLP